MEVNNAAQAVEHVAESTRVVLHVNARILTLACILVIFSGPALLAGIDQESNTDGFDPAADSYRINEARRQNAIARQLELKYRMMWEFGVDPANPPVDQPIGHESKQIGPNKWIYRPIYSDEVEIESVPADGPELLPAPNADAPLNIGPVAPTRKVPQVLPKPADAQPRDFIPPQKTPPSKRRGPREL